MKTVEWKSLDSVQPAGDSAITLGVFDGVHPGHQRLIDRVTGSEDAQAVVVSFRSPPAERLFPDRFPGRLMSLAQRLERFERAGIDTTVLIDFDEEFASMPGARFLDTLERTFSIKSVVIGWNFRCGRGNDTNAEAIARRFGPQTVTVLQPVVLEGRPVSSTRLRLLVGEGDYPAFERIAGYPYTLDVRGLQPSVAADSVVRFPLNDGTLSGQHQLIGPQGVVRGQAIGKAIHSIDVKIGPQYLQTPLVENDSIDYIVLNERREKET